MDYGHPLQFGTFITPVNDPPEAAVERAELSERLGFDLVTFQDHPYQPGFLDTWTLMSWVAARTERIHIAANVLNSPMRPAPVCCRAGFIAGREVSDESAMMSESVIGLSCAALPQAERS